MKCGRSQSEPDMKTLKVGVIGCGGNSDFHLMVYHSLKGVQLSGVCDIQENLAKEKAARWKAEHIYTDYRLMLDLDLDLVDIITPTPTHVEIANAAMQSGKHVLVEKPMALTSEECRDMITTSKKTDKTLCVFHNLRFLDSVQKTKAALEAEGLTVSRSRFSYFFAQPYKGFTPAWAFEEETGGILWDAMVHHTYLLEYLLGKIDSVYAIAAKIRKPVNDSLTLILNSKGRPGICEYEWDVKETQRTVQLLTTAGDRFDIDLSHDFMRRKSRRSGGRWRSAYMALADDITLPILKWGHHVGNFLRTQSYREGLPMEKAYFKVIGQVVSYMKGLATSQPVTGEEGLRSILVLEAARRSLQSGRVEPVGVDNEFSSDGTSL